MKLSKYNTKERIHNMRLLTKDEYVGFIKTNADDIVSTEDILVPPDFAITHTSEKKIRKAILFYHENGYFDKPIIVVAETNERGQRNKLILVDGLSRYIAAIRLYVDIISVKYIGIEDAIFN